MRIFLAVASVAPEYGGPAVSVPRLGAALAAAGAEVGLWAADGTAARHDGGGGGVVRLAGPLAAALARFGRPDIVHDNGVWLPSNHAVAVAARRAGVPRVVTPRGMLEPWAFAYKPLKKRLAFALYQRRDLARAAVLHATAASEAAALARFALPVPVRVVPNGMDLPPPPPPRPEQPLRTALFLSRVHPKKGLGMLVEAWAALRPPGWRLVIAGPDELGHAAEVAALAARLGVAGEVALVGPRYGADKARLLAEAELFVLPTFSENFGMAVAEALAHEIPVLTTTAAPWESLLGHRCGWWVAPTAAGVRDGLRAALATDAAERRLMGRRGRSLIAAEFGWDGIAERMLAVYRDAAAA